MRKVKFWKIKCSQLRSDSLWHCWQDCFRCFRRIWTINSLTLDTDMKWNLISWIVSASVLDPWMVDCFWPGGPVNELENQMGALGFPCVVTSMSLRGPWKLYGVVTKGTGFFLSQVGTVLLHLGRRDLGSAPSHTPGPAARTPTERTRRPPCWEPPFCL